MLNVVDALRLLTVGVLSTVVVETRSPSFLDVLDEDGATCGTVNVEEERQTLSLERHHQLIAREATFALPQTLCGPTVRASVVVENRGPAPLVVHASNSSMLTLVE